MLEHEQREPQRGLEVRRDEPERAARAQQRELRADEREVLVSIYWPDIWLRF